MSVQITNSVSSTILFPIFTSPLNSHNRVAVKTTLAFSDLQTLKLRISIDDNASASTVSFLSELLSHFESHALKSLFIVFMVTTPDTLSMPVLEDVRTAWQSLDATLCLPRFQPTECIFIRAFVEQWEAQQYHPVHEDILQLLLPKLSKRPNLDFSPLRFSMSVAILCLRNRYMTLKLAQ